MFTDPNLRWKILRRRNKMRSIVKALFDEKLLTLAALEQLQVRIEKNYRRQMHEFREARKPFHKKRGRKPIPRAPMDACVFVGDGGAVCGKPVARGRRYCCRAHSPYGHFFGQKKNSESRAA